MLGEWESFERHFGPLLLHERVDYAGAQVAHIIALANGAKDAKLSDFIPDWGGQRSTSNDEQIVAMLKAMRDGKRKD